MESPERLFARYALTGDPNALAEVFDRTAPELLRLALHLSNEADAEDLLQATFLTAIQKARRFDQKRALLPWLCGILVNHARRLADQRRRRKPPSEAAAASDPVEDVARLELSDALQQALERLGEPYQQPLQLRLVDGLSAVQIARRLRRSPGAVRVQIHRGLDKLRRLLPPGLAVGLSALPVKGLAAVRQAVLTQAPAAASTALFLGGILVLKKLSLAAVLVSLLVILWFLSQDVQPPGVLPTAQGTEEGSPPESASFPVPRTSPPVEAAAVREALRASPSDASLLVRVRWTTGAPAPGMALRLAAQDGRDPRYHGREAMTGMDGTVLFENVPPGLARVDLDRGPGAEKDLSPGERASLDLVVAPDIDVDGRVVDGRGDPVAGAGVWLNPPSRYNDSVPALLDPVTRSDADGRFHIRSANQSLDLGARAPVRGYSRLAMVGRSEMDEPVEVTLVLEVPAFDLEGRVLDRQGRPVASALVAIGERGNPNPVELPDGTWSDFWLCYYTRTDDHGSFHAPGLRPGKLWVRAEAEGHAPWERQLDLPQPGNQELAITLDPGGTVVGRVTNREGHPVPGAAIVPVWRSIDLETVVEVMRTSPQGRFELSGLPAGIVRLIVHADGYQRIDRELLLQAGEPTPWDPVLIPLPSIAGRILDEGGEPIPDVDVIGQRQGKGPGLGLVMDTTGPDGRFSLSVEEEREYRLASREKGSPILLSAGPPVAASAEELVFTLHDGRRANALLAGVVVDDADRPVGDAWLEIGYEDPFYGWNERSVGYTDSEHGSFRIGPLPPGKYTLHVSPKDKAVPPANLGPFDVYSHQVLDLGRIAPAPSGELLFAYSLRGGGRVEQISARARVEDGTDVWISAVPDQATRHRLPVGEYRLEVWGTGFATVTDHPLTIRENETTRVELELEPGVRRRLHFPVPLPDDCPEAGGAEIVLRRAGEIEAMYRDRLELRRPLRYSPSLGLGTYVMELSLEDGRRFSGSFTIEDLAATETPLEISMRPL